ncbi:phage terminase large subunit [Sphingomonas aliaeris]|uniref:Phage terminase large subunit n=1 Tax=Sphingomonas aliaeris TaxID=2759526 RepID=A0A974S4K1_9SPHN|nr:phage terminase large subunit [Sphingomonas aliaeris]QQV77529.1 phage terminase large subunit [Sphingomonas aliaeris]
MNAPHDISSVLNELCRADLQVFVERVFATIDPAAELERGRYLEILCDYLARVERGDLRRLLITIPPRHLKSIATSIALPAWVLGRDPSKRIINVTYANDLTRDHSRNFLKVARSGWYAHVFPETATNVARATIGEFRTRQNGFRMGSSLGGTLTGLGGDMIIIDDLMKAADARSAVARENVRHFYGNTLVSRLNDKSSGSIIAVQQRLHEEDLAAHLKDLKFEHLNLPAIAEERQVFHLSSGRTHVREPGDLLKPRTEPREILDEFRQAMSGPDFQAQYQQNPTPPESALIDWTRIQTYAVAPERDQILYVTQSWDTALCDGPKSDFSVGTTWGYDGTAWLLLDLARVRLSYADLLERVRRERKRWKADAIIVEAAGMGHALLNELSRDHRCLGRPEHHAATCERHGYTPTMGKPERLAVGVDRLYSGLVRLPEAAPWLSDLKREMLAFPSATHDDQVDSITQFLLWVVERRGRSAASGGRDSRVTAPRRP